MRSDEAQKILLTRLARIEGQVKGLSRMVREERTCEEIAHQVSAVRAGIGKIGYLLIENKFAECVDIKIQDEKVETLRRLIEKLVGK
ncbi:MAG: metal-sensitive transcriptional regulator [Caldisericia bacterium]|nr:metal-sensitive transcriptional regulator [Caldisericia bacterium]